MKDFFEGKNRGFRKDPTELTRAFRWFFVGMASPVVDNRFSARAKVELEWHTVLRPFPERRVGYSSDDFGTLAKVIVSLGIDRTGPGRHVFFHWLLATARRKVREPYSASLEGSIANLRPQD